MKIKFIKAGIEHVELYYNWANDSVVRNNSFSAEPIEYEVHVNWFKKRIDSESTFFYLFINEQNAPVGQVRIEKSETENVIGISIDANFRGMGLGSEMLVQACSDYFIKCPENKITAYIKEENVASYRIFLKAGFQLTGKEEEGGSKNYKLVKLK